MERKRSGGNLNALGSSNSTTAMGSSSNNNNNNNNNSANNPGAGSNSNANASVDNPECWDSISYLESAFHHGFMRSRLKTGEFVYHENTRLTRELDEFCDVDAMHQPKGPIILLGESGVGKSAFLANWLVRRKKMFQNWQTSYPEFIFYHVVGCTRQSCFVSNLLERILREIKEYFELNKEIPDVEERLGWQFPRFLEAASKKGRVILIIDGLQRLRTSDGESILKWVPLAFPPNVRIIFSGTINYPTSKFVNPAGSVASHAAMAGGVGMGLGPGIPHTNEPVPLSSEHREKANLNAQMIERIKLEANRRNWASVHVPTLTEDDRKRIVMKFLHKHPHRPSRSMSVSSSISDALYRNDNGENNGDLYGGLQLFEIQQKAVVAVPMTANPHFLKLLLTCLAWAVDEGFNIHYVFENWLSAESIGQLLEAILRSMETGFTPDKQNTDDAFQFLAENSAGKAHQQRIAHPPIRRKISADVVSSMDKQQLMMGDNKVAGGGHFVDEAGFMSPSGGRPGSTSSPTTKEYGYHDARIPSGQPILTEKTVVEFNYDDDTLPRRSSMPTRDEIENGAVNTSSSNERPARFPAVTRTNSAHETKEIFVATLRNDSTAGRGLANTILEDFKLASSPVSFAAGLPPGGGVTLSSSSPPLRMAGNGSGGMGDAASRASSPAKPLFSHSSMHSQSARVPPTSPMRPSSRESELPPYLTGGCLVAPLGELLGRAMSLLYVCRHGMLTNELRFILNAIVTEERESNKQQLHRKTSFVHVKDLDQQSLTGFSEDEWRALLRAMKSLGMLFVQDVVVLPICKEILREVVWWRYIGSERLEQKYHQWLIRFFRIHPTTFRRVEELPWHLKRCYQWDALRNVLVNLSMFQLLYTANYKNELFGYWKTLTDGPLQLYNASDTAVTGDPPMYTLPFDIVKEYGKSVEDWYKSARPPTKTFTPIVQLVTKFMYEFSLSYQGYLPAFNYAPFDLKKLFHDGFSFTEDLPHVQSSSTSAVASGAASVVSSAVPSSSSLGTATSTLIVALESFPSLGQANTGTTTNGSSLGTLAGRDKDEAGNWFYFYQRWIWIQFPWLALGKEIMIREPFVSLNHVTGSSHSGGSGISSSQSQQVSVLSSGGLDALSADSGGDGGDEELRREGDLARNGPGNALLAPLHHASISGVSGGTSGKSIIHFDARFWDVKKSMFESNNSGEHALKKKGAMSPSKIAALQNSSVLSPAPTTKTQDVISPENLFRKKATYVAVKNVLSSSVRRLPTAIANAALPLARVPEHRGGNNNELSTHANGTTFVTETLLANGVGDLGSADLMILQQLDLNLLDTNSKASLGTKDLVLEHLNVSDAPSTSLTTAFGLPAHFQDYPQSEWDLKRSYNYAVVLKLQTLYDTMKTEVHKKQSHLQQVKKKIAETKRRYELTMRECDMAKHAIDEMSARMERIELMVVAIDKQEKNHRKLIRGCETFMACDPAHFDTMKKELKLLQVKLKDLAEEKKVLRLKKNHLQSMEVPLLRKAMEKSKKLLSAVVEKLEKAREKAAHDQASTDKLYQRRLEMIDSVRNANFKESGESLEEVESATSQLTAGVTTRSLAAKVALQQCESMCEKIQKATGFSKLELILQKFVSREELNKSFEEQAKIYEARLKQIKLHQAELEQQLHSLEVSNAVAASDDPRVLEEKLRVAELELARIERTQNSLLTTSKEVIAGTSRIVKLIGVTSCRDPYENALPAARLWPPPLGFDGESSLTSEFETLELKDIANLLQVCQDRASMMIDAIEGGRGDPDANFSVLYELPTKARTSKLRGEEKPATRAGRPKKHSSNGNSSNNGAEKRERGFDRGSIPAITLPVPSSADFPSGSQAYGAGVSSSAAADVGGDSDGDDDPATRESVKASSRSKLATKKRVAGHSAAPGGGGLHHAPSSSVVTGPPGL
ncbi:hypothetical protein Gpo141_00001832 [Globisporangium polare]